MEVALVEGDGIGPEVVESARKCLETIETDIEFVEALMGEKAIEREGTPLPPDTVETIKRTGCALKGPVKTPVGSGFRSVNVELRRRLDLYANIRPCRYMKGVSSRISDPGDIDLVVFRENLEDLYSGIEFEEGTEGSSEFSGFLEERGFETEEDSAFSVKPISREGSRRIIRRAFEYAESEGREKVTLVDKSNIMKHTDGLFMEVGNEISEEYSVDYEHVLVDNMAQQLVLKPESYDVIVTQNIYGDILSDLCAGLVGGVGVVPSANTGDENAVFATVHGTAPDIAGEGVADPAGMILSAAMLLDHLGAEEAERLRVSLRRVVEDGARVTPDLGGDSSTEEMTEAVIEGL